MRLNYAVKMPREDGERIPFDEHRENGMDGSNVEQNFVIKMNELSVSCLSEVRMRIKLSKRSR